MANFSIGDTIQLNSGGPNLVVEILYDNLDIGATWINTEGAVKTMRAPIACFTLINKVATDIALAERAVALARSLMDKGLHTCTELIFRELVAVRDQAIAEYKKSYLG